MTKKVESSEVGRTGEGEPLGADVTSELAGAIAGLSKVLAEQKTGLAASKVFDGDVALRADSLEKNLKLDPASVKFATVPNIGATVTGLKPKRT